MIHMTTSVIAIISMSPSNRRKSELDQILKEAEEGRGMDPNSEAGNPVFGSAFLSAWLSQHLQLLV